MARRTYGQYCALARTLDLVGERWTLLVVRELIAGPKRYSDILGALPGIGTSLLATRLKGLERDGLVHRRYLPAPAASSVYELTMQGRELAAALVPLTLWGARNLLGRRRRAETFRAEWPLLMLVALIDRERARGIRATYEFHIERSIAHLRVDEGRVTVEHGPAQEPADATITIDVASFVDVGLGRLDPLEAVASGRMSVEGAPDALERLLTLLPNVQPTAAA